jgi:CRP-like cAMP-binding protein
VREATVISDQETLSRLYLFREVPVSALQELCVLAPPVQFQAGSNVFAQGDAADTALLVVEGCLVASVEGRDGQKIVGDSRAGEIVGETGLFARDMLRSASVMAAEDSRCLLVDRNLLRNAGDNPALAALERHLLGTMARRIRRTNQTMQMVWKEKAPTEQTSTEAVPPSEEGATLRGKLSSLFSGWF